MRRAALPLLLALVVAGCVAPGAVTPEAAQGLTEVELDAAITNIFDIGHDHLDPAIHAAKWNAELVTHLQPQVEGLDYLTFEEMDLMGDLLLVGINAGTVDAGTIEGGFAVFDVSDPTAPVFLHYERSPDAASCIGDVKAGPGETQVTLGTQCSRDPNTPQHGLAVYDLADPKAPELLLLGAVRIGCHMVDVAVVDGESWIYCAAQLGAQAYRLTDTPLGTQAVPVNLNLPQEPTAATHVPQAIEEFGTGGPSYFITGPHDMTTQADPLTGDPIVVVSHSYSGVRILDGSDPTLGRVLGVWDGAGAETYSWIHTAQAVDIGGKRIVVAITENVVNTPPRFWVIDFTDYADPVLLAEHWLAQQDDSQDLVYSLHNFQVVGTRMYMGAYHAGTWVLDLADPTKPVELAFALSGATPYPHEEGEFYGIGNQWPEQVWDVVVKDGYVLASDMSSGLHVYAVEGDAHGDATLRSFG